MPAVMLLVLVGAGWLFRAPLMNLIDQLRLPLVEKIRVSKRSAVAVAAVSGTAANGYIVARKRAALSADTPGRIVEMNVQEGTFVQQGDVVARLYSQEYAASLRRAEANLELGQASLQRAHAEVVAAEAEAKRLQSVVAASEANQEETLALLELAESRMERARKLVADGVEQGRVLEDAQGELEAAQARHNAAISGIASAKADHQQGLSRVQVSRAAVKETEAQQSVLKATRDQAQATLDKTEVRAPFAGIVVLKDAEVGEVVSPNSQGGNSRGSVITMVDFETLEVQAEVPETSLSAVQMNAPARIYLDARPEYAYPGRVDRIWPTANRQKATVEVRIVFEERDEFLRPEMGVRVVFTESPVELAGQAEKIQPEVVIPVDAVIRIEGQSGVFVLERDTVRFQDVELGNQRSGRFVVLNGLSGGEDIVISPPATLNSGDRVRIQP